MTRARGRIAILREPDRAEPLRAALVKAGFEVVVQPMTRIEYVSPRVDEDWPAWTQVADWVVFTSVNGVQGFARGVGGEAVLVELLKGRHVAVLGVTSAQRLAFMDVAVTLREEQGTSNDLVRAILPLMRPESAVLYPCAEKIMPALPQTIQAAGHRLRQVVCYRTLALSTEAFTALNGNTLDAALVAAPSAVHALCDALTPPAGLGFFAIGPTTAAALRKAGLTVLGVSESPNVESIVQMIAGSMRTTKD